MCLVSYGALYQYDYLFLRIFYWFFTTYLLIGNCSRIARCIKWEITLNHFNLLKSDPKKKNCTPLGFSKSLRQFYLLSPFKHYCCRNAASSTPPYGCTSKGQNPYLRLWRTISARKRNYFTDIA